VSIQLEMNWIINTMEEERGGGKVRERNNKNIQIKTRRMK
jgi:hypothetical protein